jgi:ABC-type transport system involved in multi-copper enzyme maturation permease subunit
MRWVLGPAFYYEWLMTARRWQLYAGRALFVTVLLVGLTIVWATKVFDKPIADLQALANVGEAFFSTIAGIQLSLVLLAAPAYTAGAICIDKARGTLLHMMVTDMSAAEIVLGKLYARLLAVLGLLFVTLPVLALATLMGGIEPEALVGSFLVSIGVAVLSCTLSLALSLLGTKTHEVLLGTYMIEIVWLLALPVATTLWKWTPAWLQCSNPYWLAFAPYLHPEESHLCAAEIFLGVCLAISAMLTLLAMSAARRVIIAQASHPSGPRNRPRDNEQSRAPVQPHQEIDSLWYLVQSVRNALSPSLNGNPVLWREWHRRRPSRWTRAVWWLYVLLAGFFTVLAIGQLCRMWELDHELPALVNAFVVAIGMLLLSVTSVTSLAEERGRRCLEVLLTTPLPSRSIVWGKWWGAFRSVPLLAVLPAVVAFAAVLRSGQVETAILLVLLVLGYGAALTSLGLGLATWIKRFSWAIAVSVTLFVMVTVGWVFALFATFPDSGIDSVGPGLALASPFWGAGLLTVEIEEKSSVLHGHVLAWASFWIISYAILANVLLALTLLTFDRCVGRGTS